MEINEKKNNLILRSIPAEQVGKKKGLFECDCGAFKELILSDVRRSHTKSCGCKALQRLSGSDNPGWQGYGSLSGKKFGSIKYDAKVRGYDFNLTIEYLWNLYELQHGRCAYSDLDINFSDNSASLDRICSKAGYIIGNVQWTHVHINFMKQTLSEERFLELIQLVYLNKIRP
jgi:hypothetical protein